LEYTGFLEIFGIFEKMSDPSLKAALPTCKADMKVISVTYIMPEVLKESIDLLLSQVCVLHDNFMSHLNFKLSYDLAANGIFNYWFDYFLNFDMKPMLEAPQEPKVFDIEDLKFGFIVWLIACAISAFSFLIEFFYFYVKKFLKSFIMLYYFFSHLRRGNW
jgi:hypothetical protein